MIDSCEAAYTEACKEIESLSQQLEELTQDRDNHPVCCCIIKDDKLVRRCQVHADDAETQAQKYKEERNEWMQQAEHRRGIIRDRKAQVQKLKDKLTRCSTMFDEVENSLADSCRREGIFKKALEKIVTATNHYDTANGERCREIAQEALPVDSKEDICPRCNGNNRDMPCAYPSEGMKGCLRDKKNMELFKPICTSCGKELSVIKSIGPMYVEPSIGSIYVEPCSDCYVYKYPDLSKCPNCGGLADNGHDRCDPPNAYYCTKCSKSEKGKVLGALYRGTIEDKSDDK